MSQNTPSTGESTPTVDQIPSEPLNILAQSMTTLVRKIQDLRHLGIEDSHITLPKICVIGDQSTGKSSLIEGMSEIKVPRSSGTCTRCPMEINLSGSKRGEPWTCHVYLSRKYMYDGSGKTIRSRKSHSLGPWVEMEQEDELFTTITDRAQIAEAIRCAQLAILNPGRAPANYLPRRNIGVENLDFQEKFSPNIVRLDISAPGFPSLSFYDLPGVINQVESDEDHHLIKLVENLVKRYISQDNCIVLLTLPMTNDVENSSAARIMNGIRGAKDRAVGVLTKPDRVQPGESFTQWLKILEGNKFSYDHGYYVVKNNHDPSVEHSVARQEEDDFFRSSPCFADLVAYRNRFGTRNLQTALSELLFQQIQACLPRIIDEIKKKAEHIDQELSRLAAPPSGNVPFILCKKLHMFKDKVHSQIDGGSRQYPLQKLWNNIAEDFKLALVMTRPTVKLVAELDEQAMDIDRDDDDSECKIVKFSTKRKLSDDSPGPSSSTVADGAKKSPKYHTEHFARFKDPACMFKWEVIRELNEDSASAGIPKLINPKAINELNKMSVAHWRCPMMIFIDESHKLAKKMILHEMKEVFVEYNQTVLFRELEKIIKTYLRQLYVEHVAHVEELYEIEHQQPFTMAYTQLDQATANARKFLESKRLVARENLYLTLQGFPKNDPRRENERKKLGVSELGVDEFRREVEMMAKTRGYYEVASTRFVDSVCQTVHTKLFSKCRETLVKTIESELGIGDENASERCNELMSEDVERQQRRQYFEREKEKVLKAQEWLNTETGTADDEDEVMGDDEPEVKTEAHDSWH
ncbi:putative dynamin GTPase [Aspergillus mulundensis]|uniref:Dynamin family protein n=1 Tax=Aspergillus mulundensis TaxID=1810919 RepID=A0A3D8S4F6_9EURO|nr:hypothetical protein DSM5745_04715 [Aspergillus mulundensis]RDW81158.1 hypothetical protein DSM5745_04715 [Aspergillus mulundensis]